MNRTQPPWVNKNLYPFNSQWIEIEGSQLHYIDEGKGEVILFVHGTPEWSFGYRDVIKELRNSYRCIAIDLLGFGLSGKSSDADYTCKGHAHRLEKFINFLHLKHITIVGNDFGGGIAMSYAIQHPDNINKIILFNTWMWSLKTDKHYAIPARLMNTWLGRILYLNFNFPVNVIMPSAYGDKSKLTSEIHRHYKNALPKGERLAAYTFSKELMNASDWWQQLWDNVEDLRQKPFLIFWGMKDSFIPPSDLAKWKLKIPEAKVVEYADAGHFVEEEKPQEMAAEIRQFMTQLQTENYKT
jgi:pimeloyl-ACP methyl ester carboxylesterase